MMNWKKYFAPHILERGIDYADEGAIQRIKKSENAIDAVVLGSDYYKVKIRLDGANT